jgi:F-type H+-transporting ATPase subunit delta
MSSRIDEQEVAVADVYAGALLKLAEQRGEGDTVLEELSAIHDLLEEEVEFAAFLSNPTVDLEARRVALDHTFQGRANDLLVNTLQVMNRRDRLNLIPALVAAYQRELDDLRRRESVEVSTAVPLSDPLREQLTRAVGKMTGRRVRLVENVDDDLIGGLVVKIGDRKIDTSVARGLALMGERFNERASAEVQIAETYVSDSGETHRDEGEK